MLIDFASFKFWMLLTVAAFVLVPLTHPWLRKIALAMVNLTFLWFMLHEQLWTLLVALAVLYGLLQLMGRSRAWPWATGVTLVLGIGLFVMHKLPKSCRRTRNGASLTPFDCHRLFLRISAIDRHVACHLGTETRAPPGPVDMLNYLMPFHMLAAGPIQAWDEFVAQPAVPPALDFKQSG